LRLLDHSPSTLFRKVEWSSSLRKNPAWGGPGAGSWLYGVRTRGLRGSKNGLEGEEIGVAGWLVLIGDGAIGGRLGLGVAG
jgi:hypothetical protein